jgi:hypothetical protein
MKSIATQLFVCCLFARSRLGGISNGGPPRPRGTPKIVVAERRIGCAQIVWNFEEYVSFLAMALMSFTNFIPIIARPRRWYAFQTFG